MLVPAVGQQSPVSDAATHAGWAEHEAEPPLMAGTVWRIPVMPMSSGPPTTAL